MLADAAGVKAVVAEHAEERRRKESLAAYSKPSERVRIMPGQAQAPSLLARMIAALGFGRRG